MMLDESNLTGLLAIGRNHLKNRRLENGLLTSQTNYADLPPAAPRPEPGMNWLQSASMATLPIPGVSDVLGLLGDAQMFYQRPETRTPANFALAALPAVPAAGGLLAMMNRQVDPQSVGLLARAMPGQAGSTGSKTTPLQRAENQGYDMAPWLHGNRRDLGKAIDPSRLGGNTGTPGAAKAFFLTRSESDAKDFAEAAARARGGVPTVSTVYVRPQHGAVYDWAKEERIPLRSQNGQRRLAQILDAARDQGLHMVVLKNADDSLAGGSTADVLAVLPEGLGNLRTKNAKFDPKNLGKAGLTLGLSGGGVAALLRDFAVAPTDDES